MRLNDLGHNLDTTLYVGQFQAGLGSPDRLHVTNWTPFVNQLDLSLYSDTHPGEKMLRHAARKSFHQRAWDISK
jgi:hypothetical protein